MTRARVHGGQGDLQAAHRCCHRDDQSCAKEQHIRRVDRAVVRRAKHWRGRCLGAGLLAAVAACCLLTQGDAAGSLLENRYKADRTCSLQTIEGDNMGPMEYCSFLPGLGENMHGRVLVHFGESNCEFTLRNCFPGYCYAIRDFAGLLPRDFDIDALENFRDVTGGTGIFKNATGVGADVVLNTGGIFFFPKASEVKITYTTKNCAEFYADYGREWPQLCEGKLGLLSNVVLAMETVEGLDCKSARI